MDGLLARQDVLLGGTGETVTISHNTLSTASYERGILLALAATRSARGVRVGLDALLDLGLGTFTDAAAPAASAASATGVDTAGTPAPESSEINV